MSILNDPLRPRGGALTIWLTLMTLANAWALYQYGTIYLDWSTHGKVSAIFPFGSADWIPVAYIILPAVNLISAGALWFWKKWGLYLFAVSSIAALALNLKLGVPPGAALVGLIGVGILYAVMRPKWHLFI
jgi:hypothetical protein